MSPIPSTATLQLFPEPVAGEKADSARLRDAAQQFEALLIAQLLRSAREAGGPGGWLGSEDAASAPLLEMAEQQVAGLLATAGGLGLASLVVGGLENKPAERTDMKK